MPSTFATRFGTGGTSDPTQSNFRSFLERTGVFTSPTDPRVTLPNELREYFQGIQENGILGAGGAGRIANQALQGATLRNKSLSRGLRRRVSRRLGPRSGAADTVIANQVIAPSFANIAELLSSLEATNQQSKLQGAAGQFDVLKFLENRYQFSKSLEAQESGGGFLDFLGPVADIVSLIPGVGAAAGAAGAVSGRANNPRGVV